MAENKYDRDLLTLGGLASSAPSAGLKAFLPIGLDPLTAMSKAGTLPPHTFSDRATGIAYQPVESGLRIKNRPLLESGKGGQFNNVFEGPLLNRTPKQANTQLTMRPSDYINEPDTHGFHRGTTDFTGKPQSEISLNPNNRFNPTQTLDTATHEYQHRLSSGDQAMPYRTQEAFGDKSYSGYRADPEEHLAFKAQAARGLKDPSQIAQVFNMPDERVSLGDMHTGNREGYSQIDTTHGGEVSTVGQAPPRPTMSGWKNWVGSVAKIGRGLGKIGGVTGAAQQGVDMNKGYDNAAKKGANKFMGMMSNILPYETTQRLPNGMTYNNKTGKTYKDYL